MLILYNVRMDMAGGVDFSAANAKSSAQLRVKGEKDEYDAFLHILDKPDKLYLSGNTRNNQDCVTQPDDMCCFETQYLKAVK